MLHASALPRVAEIKSAFELYRIAVGKCPDKDVLRLDSGKFRWNSGKFASRKNCDTQAHALYAHFVHKAQPAPRWSGEVNSAAEWDDLANAEDVGSHHCSMMQGLAVS